VKSAIFFLDVVTILAWICYPMERPTRAFRFPRCGLGWCRE